MFRRHLRFLPLLLILIASTTQATDSYSAVASFFAEYDSMLEEVAKKAQRVTSLSATEKMLKKQMQEYSCASYFLRTNSKGKIIAKVTEKGVQPRNFRHIAKQKWFQIISMTNKPYYGYTKSRSSYYLFWNKPIYVKKRGAIHFGGSISAKINMRKSFKTIAEKEGVIFKVKLKNKTLFSNLPKGVKNTITKPLSIGGLPVLTISYPTGNPTAKTVIAAQDKSTQQAQKVATKESTTEKTVVAKADIKKVAKADTPKETAQAPKTESIKEKAIKNNEPPKKVAPTVEAKEAEKKGAPVSPVLLVIAAAIIILFGILIFIVVSRIRNQKLLDAIENDEL